MKLPRVEDILPHRPPFLMIDTIEELNAERVVASKLIGKNDPYLIDGKPDRMFPGVMIIEAMVQTGALYATRVPGFDPAKHVVHLLMVQKAKFRRPVWAGEVMRLEVKPLRSGVALWSFAGAAYVGSALAATARFVGVGLPIEEAQAFLARGGTAP